MDSSQKLFKVNKDGRLNAATVRAIEDALSYHLPVTSVASSHGLIWEDCLKEIKGYSFTRKLSDQIYRQTCTGA